MKKATLIITMIAAFFVLVVVGLLSWMVKRGDDEGIKEGTAAYARLVKRIRKEEKEKLEEEGCEDCRKNKLKLESNATEENEELERTG